MTSNEICISIDTNEKIETPEEIYNKKETYMLSLEVKIDTEIGYHFWNRYVVAAFWSNISLPINLSITMLTALSTGQATTDNLLPRNLYVNISIATLVISTLNTYFRPHLQMNKNLEIMNKWNAFGCEFEEIFYSEKERLIHLEDRITRYEDLIRKIQDLKKNENMESINLMTDVIYYLLRMCKCFLRNKSTWLSIDEKIRLERIQNHSLYKKHKNSQRTLELGDLYPKQENIHMEMKDIPTPPPSPLEINSNSFTQIPLRSQTQKSTSFTRARPVLRETYETDTNTKKLNTIRI